MCTGWRAIPGACGKKFTLDISFWGGVLGLGCHRLGGNIFSCLTGGTGTLCVNEYALNNRDQRIRKEKKS